MAVWRDPLDELIDALDRTVTPVDGFQDQVGSYDAIVAYLDWVLYDRERLANRHAGMTSLAAEGKAYFDRLARRLADGAGPSSRK